MSQKESILSLFTERPNDNFTPYDIHVRMVPTIPITSVRRAISDLTREGLLVKTSSRYHGAYHTYNYGWRLAA